MPRGRHRHSPPLHRLFPPSAIAVVSVACALGPWVFTETALLRALAAGAAVTAVVGAVVMRHWDAQAGRRVADLTRARANDEWRHEERVAELESDLEESRELRQKLEQRLRAKRTELAGLRNEHASLLRRYATAETERASALEGRRLLEIEAVPQVPALPPARTAPEEDPTAPEEQGRVPAAFSAEGTGLYARASAALARFEDGGGHPDGDDGDDDGGDDDGGGGRRSAARETGTAGRPKRDGHVVVPAAAAVVPESAGRRPEAEGGFDYFGTKGGDPVQHQDLADVVGPEVLAEDARASADDEPPARVIDLAGRDEAARVEAPGLRSAAS